MIPEFNEHGYLPPGIHLASLDEIAERFGHGAEVRQAGMESLRWAVHLARCAGVKRMIVNGTFVTSALEPQDVDCVLLTDAEYPKDVAAAAEIEVGIAFASLEVVDLEGFEFVTQRVFASDRWCIPKGMVEVLL